MVGEHVIPTRRLVDGKKIEISVSRRTSGGMELFVHCFTTLFTTIESS